MEAQKDQLMHFSTPAIRKWACALILLVAALLSPAAYSARTHGHHPSGVVVIDPGHGGRDTGTRSKGHLLEKNLNLAIAAAVAADLRRCGVSAIMTRNSDHFIELDERANISNQKRAKLFVSIHCDSNPDRSMSGFSILVPESYSPKASAAARAVSRQLQRTGVERRTVRRDDRGLYVLNATASPSILVEIGFLSNRAEAADLASPRYQQRVARALSAGIRDYLRTH